MQAYYQSMTYQQHGVNSNGRHDLGQRQNVRPIRESLCAPNMARHDPIGLVTRGRRPWPCRCPFTFFYSFYEQGLCHSRRSPLGLGNGCWAHEKGSGSPPQGMCNADHARALEQRHACMLQALQVWSELDMMSAYMHKTKGQLHMIREYQGRYDGPCHAIGSIGGGPYVLRRARSGVFVH